VKKVAITCVTLCAISAVVAGIALVAGCSAKVDVKSTDAAASAAQAASVAASAVEIEKPSVIPVDDRLAAILRTSDRLQQVCYGGSDENPHREIFYIKYATRPDDNIGDGWIFIDDQSFSPAPNGKWWTETPNIAKYSHIYPDVTGLQCKQQ